MVIDPASSGFRILQKNSLQRDVSAGACFDDRGTRMNRTVLFMANEHPASTRHAT